MNELEKRKTSWKAAFLLLAVLMLLALASGVWAAPSQKPIRQTVPTRTPTAAPATDTPVPATNTPVPPTPTPNKDKDKKRVTPTVEATQATQAETPVSELSAEAAATATTIAATGLPESGADYVPYLWGGLLAAIAGGTTIYIIRHRKATDG